MPAYPLPGGHSVQVDKDDWVKMQASGMRWFVWKPTAKRLEQYVMGERWRRSRRVRRILLHRFLLDAPDNVRVYFHNGDGLDCRRENLFTKEAVG